MDITVIHYEYFQNRAWLIYGVQQSWFLLGQIPCEIFKQFKLL